MLTLSPEKDEPLKDSDLKPRGERYLESFITTVEADRSTGISIRYRE